MASRPAIELELVPLLKALRSRIEALRGVSAETRDGVEIHKRGDMPFAQLEVRRDHMYLDLWLPDQKLEEARASGIARAHPFMENEAVRVRFERAEDLTRVAHWLEESYLYAAVRAKRRARAEKKKAAKTESKTSKNATTKRARAAATNGKATSNARAPAKKAKSATRSTAKKTTPKAAAKRR